MKIAILTSGILPVPAVLGGAVENLIDYYIEYNNQEKLHDITVYSIAPPQSSSIADTANTHYHYIDTTSFWGRLKRHIYVRTHSSTYYNPYIEYFLHESLKDIARKEYDLIILENRPGYAIPVSKVSKAKIIIHLHNDLLNKDSKNAKEICQVCHKVITVSDYIKGRVKTIGSNIPITTVHNGIDLERFYRATPIDRKSLGFKEDDFIVVYSGRLIKEKGIEELIDAFNQLKDYPQIKLLILGGSFYGLSANNTFLDTLKKKSENIKDSIVFTGFIPYEQLPRYLKIGDVAIVPSMWEEPFGLTCIEAMAAGLPLITTNSGGIPETCKENSIIIKKEYMLNQIPKSIINLYENNNEIMKMKIKGKEKSTIFNKNEYSKLFFNSIK
ncbi:MAG: glycosyltransferase family 4 protein [Bacteroides sp.]|nr:glycosyltransferase family 4 protein [Bacteroides sp.]